ncbi:MAG: FlgD immunoglobulin-like domain containing protein [Candidatus Eisenbacteria bacterium]
MNRMKSAGLVAALAALLAVATWVPAEARWPGIGQTLSVSSNTEDELGSVTVLDGNGGAIVVFTRGLTPKPCAKHIASNGVLDPAWPADGRILQTQWWSAQQLRAVSDGAGGAIVAWLDDRSAPVTTVVAQRIRYDGTLDPAWPATGVVLCSATGLRTALEMVSDDCGGAILSWVDLRSGLLDVYAQRVRVTGIVDPAWPADGRLLCNNAAQQMYPTMISDGRNGAIVAWSDLRFGNEDIYAQHVWSNGTLDSAWPATGISLCNAAGNQTLPEITSDGAYGAIVVWQDGRPGTHTDVYAQHVLAAGTVDPAWTANGVLVCSAANNQQQPLVVSDGAGGAIASWLDHRNSPYVECGFYVQHVRAAGSVDPAWPANGRLVYAYGTYDMYEPRLLADDRGGAIVGWTGGSGGGYYLIVHHVFSTGMLDTLWSRVDEVRANHSDELQGLSLASDGAGGVIYSWSDAWYPGNHDIEARRVDRWGAFSGAAYFGLLHDSRRDQGGIVEGYFYTSEVVHDRPEWMEYRIWRQVPVATAQARIAAGGREMRSSGSCGPARPGDLMYVASGAPAGWWEYVWSDDESGWVSSRNVWLATTRDSLPNSNPYTRFMIETWRYWGDDVQRWFSDVDSAYSADDIGPDQVYGFHATFGGGHTTIRWNKVAAPDLRGYAIHRTTHPLDVPSLSNFVTFVTDTTWVDPSGLPWFYYVIATDIHGNQGPWAFGMPDGVLDTDGRPAALALSAPLPNPAREATSFRLALPGAARVRADVFDPQGRRVRALLSREFAPGEHLLGWDGRDDDGRRAADGLYFVRVDVGGTRFTRRVVLAR